VKLHAKKIYKYTKKYASDNEANIFLIYNK